MISPPTLWSGSDSLYLYALSATQLTVSKHHLSVWGPSAGKVTIGWWCHTLRESQNSVVYRAVGSIFIPWALSPQLDKPLNSVIHQECGTTDLRLPSQLKVEQPTEPSLLMEPLCLLLSLCIQNRQSSHCCYIVPCCCQWHGRQTLNIFTPPSNPDVCSHCWTIHTAVCSLVCNHSLFFFSWNRFIVLCNLFV